jgi:hypothetical protein
MRVDSKSFGGYRSASRQAPKLAAVTFLCIFVEPVGHKGRTSTR